ncbi:uncharacterized protein LOC128234930 [Mya arenaria]|uniref:uncharacterized protein LOC128234930 n=1 Tax=Mya arenaria TaxID=6604 RepID=UPI0022E977CC|nr:uncharacterized protein LOC128234930 [Mya arenaria]
MDTLIAIQIILLQTLMDSAVFCHGRVVISHGEDNDSANVNGSANGNTSYPYEENPSRLSNYWIALLVICLVPATGLLLCFILWKLHYTCKHSSFQFSCGDRKYEHISTFHERPTNTCDIESTSLNDEDQV